MSSSSWSKEYVNPCFRPNRTRLGRSRRYSSTGAASRESRCRAAARRSAQGSSSGLLMLPLGFAPIPPADGKDAGESLTAQRLATRIRRLRWECPLLNVSTAAFGNLGRPSWALLRQSPIRLDSGHKRPPLPTSLWSYEDPRKRAFSFPHRPFCSPARGLVRRTGAAPVGE